MTMRWNGRLGLALAVLAVLAAGLMGVAVPAQADTFTFTSCHITVASPPCTATGFGTVTLTQSGTSVDFAVTLLNGNRFVETGSGAKELFLFNDNLSGSTITT